MTLIQIILCIGLLIATVLCLAALKNRLIARLFFLGQFVLGIILVIFPELANKLANFLGVGRGADLILYLLVIYVYVGSILILGKFRSLENTITELARKTAIENSEKNPNNDDPSKSSS